MVWDMAAQHSVALRENDLWTLKNLEARVSPRPVAWAGNSNLSHWYARRA